MKGACAGLQSLLAMLDAGGEVVIAGLGDSLTYGWMVQRGYFDLFCDQLEQRYLRGIIRRINAGVPGDTASGGFARIGSILEKHPDVVAVQFGINDMHSGESVDAFEFTIETIARRILERDSVPLLATSCPILAEEDGIQPFYDAIRRVGAALDICVADIDAYWRSALANPDRLGELYLADGVHPSDQGHYLMAEAVLALFFAGRDTILTPPPV